MAMQMVYGTRRQDAERLAQKARDEGVRLKRDRMTGQFYATSSSRLGTLHHVTLTSCDCQGFARYHRCKHMAALLAHFGVIK